MKFLPIAAMVVLVFLSVPWILTLERLASANYLLGTEMQKKRIAESDTTKPVTRRAIK